MHGFLCHLKAAWLFGRHFPYIPEADESWSDGDAQATKAFFESGSGRRLSMRLKNLAIRSALKAVQSPNGDHAGGIAAGIGMCVSVIDSHSQYEIQEEEQADNVVNL